MVQTKKADYILVICFAALLVFGLVMLASASAPFAYKKFGDSYFFIKRQLIYGVLPGLIAFFFFAKYEYQKLFRFATPIGIASVILLLLVFIPQIGTSLNTGAQSWIQIGNISLQPAECAKFGLIIFLSACLVQKGQRITDPKEGFLPVLALAMVFVVLVLLQPDVGTVAVLFSIIFALLFVAGAKLSHLLSLALSGVLGLAVMILIAPYRAARLTTFLHPELDPQGIGYHINQAFLAIGSGGLFGLGIGHSRQKFQYLPEVHADSIFAVISEELGFVFASIFICFLLFIAFRALRIARQAPDQFGRLLVTGIIVWFMVQSFFNIGAIVGLMPLTGLPLPFVSHGGTALMITMAALGVIVNVSKHRVSDR